MQETLSNILVQTARVSGLAQVYADLLTFDGRYQNARTHECIECVRLCRVTELGGLQRDVLCSGAKVRRPAIWRDSASGNAEVVSRARVCVCVWLCVFFLSF